MSKFLPTFLALLFFVGPAIAAPKENLVVIVNFDCPHCQEFSESVRLIDSAMDEKNVNTVMAPLPLDFANSLRETIYYRANMVKRSHGRNVLKTFFRLSKQDIKVENLEDAISWLSIDYPNTDWSTFLTIEGLEAGKGRMARAAKLAIKAGVVGVPAYIQVVEKKVEQIVLDGPVQVQVSKLINHF